MKARDRVINNASDFVRAFTLTESVIFFEEVSNDEINEPNNTL